MYNGIGLKTPRGSGTNGYIQTNMAHIRNARNTIREYEQFRNEVSMNNIVHKKYTCDFSIIEHAEKRRIELEVLLYEEKMRQEGSKNIEELIKNYRQKLYDEYYEKKKIQEKYNVHNNREADRSINIIGNLHRQYVRVISS